MSKSANFSIRDARPGLADALEQVMGDIDLRSRVGSSVFIKPNFTYPYFKPGITTTRELIVEVVRALRDLGCSRICLGEGDGGYNTFSMDETFRNYRLEELTAEFGLEVVNVARWPSREFTVENNRGRFAFNLPAPLFEEFDSMITLPVPKVHALTTVSLAVKNQWGLIQDPMRLRFHLAFNEIITLINRSLPRISVIVDGTFGLTNNGPMLDGIPLELGWVAASDNLWLNDVIVTKLMHMDVDDVEHLKYVRDQGLVPADSDSAIKGELAAFVDDRFYLKRSMWNRAAKLTWWSPALNHLVYFSRASSLLHKVMYTFRPHPDDLSLRGVNWK